MLFRSSSGRVLYSRPPAATEIVVAPAHVGAMNDMLNAAMVKGTGRLAGLMLHPAAGKTGTTQDFRDAWFIGYTAHLACGVWVGNDQGRTMNNVRGGSLPAAIWRQIMTTAHEGRAVVALPGTAAPAPASVRETAPPQAMRSTTSWPASAKATDYYRPSADAPRAAAPLLPRDRINGDFVARALVDDAIVAQGEPVASQPNGGFTFPRFLPAGMMSLGRKAN